MGFFDYLRTGEFTSYQIIVLILIVYAFTYGKSDFKKLDRYIQTKVAAWKGEPLPEKEKLKKLSGKEHAKKERKQFYIHLIIYMALHVIFALLFGFSDSILQAGSTGGFLDAWFDASDSTIPFNNTNVNNVTRIWTLILVIDGIISLSYTLFPKKEKDART
ncbi:hypothetical protein [Thalassobacillus pellis]|uniref:hypothetical protein n=1 Tax=Thalassobacillus pellis TaxID=748008 RepID=UPI001EF7825B|nr:hypothetical protein [Thalassobacillus pellis]MBM7553498.1 NADH:ubiquinone oxidoreductase subunit 3 (subunit A) [Thalassobacillus pellis]